MKIRDLGLYHQTLFNFLCDAGELNLKLMHGSELDLFEGKAVVTVAALTFPQAKLWGLQWVKGQVFGLEVRTYLKTKVGTEWRKSNLSLHWQVSQPKLAAFFKWGLGVQAQVVPIQREVFFEPFEKSSRGNFHYQTQLGNSPLKLKLRTISSPQPAMAGYLEYFVTERNQWTSIRNHRIYQLSHEPWFMWETDKAECAVDWAKTPFPFLAGKNLHSTFVVKGSKVSFKRIS